MLNLVVEGGRVVMVNDFWLKIVNLTKTFITLWQYQTWFSSALKWNSTFQFSNFWFSSSNSVFFCCFFSLFTNPDFFPLFSRPFRRIVYKPTSDWSIDRTINWFSEIIIASVYKIGRGYQFMKKEWSMPSRVVEIPIRI